jgi:capsule polysaccharide export protein KpsC/LpsZ
MRGEGAITESEGKLAERAFSGDIDSLTAQEIKQIANASKRVAQYSISEYNRKLDIVGKNPEMKDIVDLYRVTPIAPMKQGNVKKFNPATGKVE